jgi:uncharacterized protein (DUF1015 family)
VAAAPVSLVPKGYWERLEAENPYSFQHVMRDTIRTSGEGFVVPQEAGGRARLDAMIRDGVYGWNDTPAFYVYRLSDGVRGHTGIVAEVAISAYEEGRIRRHEYTHRAAEERLAHHMAVLRADSYPVALTYRSDSGAADVAAEARSRRPLIDFAADGMEQTVWVVDDPEEVRRMGKALAAIRTLYITDGHHRCAAAARFAREEEAAHPGDRGDEPYHYLLAILFPESELQIMEYNRCIRDLDGLTPEEFLARIGEVVTVEEVGPGHAEAARPDRAGVFGMALGGRWFRLTVPPDRIPDDAYGRLDAVLLQRLILDPILGIVDPRSDPRIDYVPGSRGIDGLQHRENCAVGFAIHAASLDDVEAVADRGMVMPPKSTWFLPKVGSGLIVRMLD